MFYIIYDDGQLVKVFKLPIHKQSIDSLTEIFKIHRESILNMNTKDYLEFHDKLKPNKEIYKIEFSKYKKYIYKNKIDDLQNSCKPLNRLEDEKMSPKFLVYQEIDYDYQIFYHIPSENYLTNSGIFFFKSLVEYKEYDNKFLTIVNKSKFYSLCSNNDILTFNSRYLCSLMDIESILKHEINNKIKNSIFICSDLDTLGINNMKRLNKILNKEKKLELDKIKVAIIKYNNKQVKEKINIKDNGSKFILEKLNTKDKNTQMLLKLINGEYGIEFFNEKTIVNTI